MYPLSLPASLFFFLNNWKRINLQHCILSWNWVRPMWSLEDLGTGLSLSVWFSCVLTGTCPPLASFTSETSWRWLESWLEGEGGSPSPVLCAHHLPTSASNVGIRRHMHCNESALLALGLYQHIACCQQGPALPPEMEKQHLTCRWWRTQVGGSGW